MQERSTCEFSYSILLHIWRLGKSTDDSFGGTDGNFHYNDTWCLDIASGEWQELSCIGYIPVPREGHAAAMVDDVIYVFGGRDVNGKDLGDLAAFRTTSMSLFSCLSSLSSRPMRVVDQGQS
jgi:hypothetical protein